MGLYISVTAASANLGDSSINQAILRLAAKLAISNRDGSLPSGPSLDVTFMLPGAEDRPTFTGMCMGGYEPEQDMLYFEKAVPEHIVQSPDADLFVAVVMEDVIAHAGNFFAEHGVRFDTRTWLTSISRLTAAHTMHA